MFFSCVCRFVPCFALCSVLSIAGLAHAHSVYIYAWPEHGSICTESYYSTEDKVRAGKVEMMTAAGESLQIVQSDQEGRACFRAPDKVEALRFVVDAGEGHRAQYTMSEEEVRAALNSLPQGGAEKHGTDASGEAQTPAKPEPMALPDDARLRALVREELQAQLAPMRQMLAQATAPHPPGWREIFGGLGWIAGLAGIGAAILARRCCKQGERLQPFVSKEP